MSKRGTQSSHRARTSGTDELPLRAFPHLAYALEKYAEAVRILATGAHDVRSRLRKASYFLVIAPEMVPDAEGVRADMLWIRSQMTKFPADRPEDSPVSETLRRIRRKTGVRIAERVVTVCYKLRHLLDLQITAN